MCLAMNRINLRGPTGEMSHKIAWTNRRNEPSREDQQEK